MEYKCINKCYFRDRIWKPGETLASVKGEIVPQHFKLKSKVKEEPKKIIEEPKTYKELQEKEAKDSRNFSDKKLKEKKVDILD